MPVLAVAAAKGSPGVTTLAVALAGLLPPPALLADLDPAGGDVWLRFRDGAGRPLDPDRGLLSFAAAALRGPGDVTDHLQVLDGGLPVLCGVTGPDQVAALTPSWPAVEAALAAHPGAVVADLGRVTAVPSASPLLRAADVLLLVSRTDAASLAHLRDRVRSCAETRGGRRGATGAAASAATGLGVVLVAPRRERSAADDVQRLLDAAGLPARVLGAVVDDPRGALVLSGARGGAPGRTDLVRSVRGLLPAVDALVAEAVPLRRAAAA